MSRAPERPPSARRGFTLIEVIAALALAGLVLLGARSLLDQLALRGTRMARDAVGDDTRANGERLLRALVRQVGVGSDSLDRFSGDAQAAEFVTWCYVPRGWQERCRIRLVVGNSDHEATITAHVPPRDTLLLWRGPGPAVLRYLDPSARDSPWVETWGSTIGAPAAIAIILPGDTLFLRARGRG